MLLLGLLLALLVVLVVYGFHPVQRWRYRHFPGPRPRWLVGNLLEILFEGLHAATERWGREYGPVWCYWMGAEPIIMTNNPECARKVLVLPARTRLHSLHIGDQERGDSYSIVFSNGETWKAARNAWQPFFSADAVGRHAPLMASSAGRLRTVLGAAADAGHEVDMWRTMGLMTMDVVGTTAFGVNFNTLEEAAGESDGNSKAVGVRAGDSRQVSSVHTPGDRLVAAVSTLFSNFGLANFYFGLLFLFPELERLIKWTANLLPNAAFRQEMAARKTLVDVSLELIQRSRQEAGQQAPSDKSGTTALLAPTSPTRRPSVVNPGSFLSLVLPSAGKTVGGRVLGDLWAINQASSFIMAGYETTANALAYSVYLLAAHPDKEAKLLAEVDAFGRERVPTAEDLQAAFPYASAVVQESLRLYPPGSVAVRAPKGPMTLGGYDVPPDAQLQVGIYSIQRSEQYWRDPLVFRPERFVVGTPEAAEVIPGAHIPFGDGVRKCIGYRFALMEATLALVMLYQQYTFRLLPGQVPLKVKTLLTTSPANGVRVTVHRRSQQAGGAAAAEE